MLCIDIVIMHLGGAQQLTLTSQPQTSGTYCLGPVTFTCVGTQINALIWLVNGSTVDSYAFQMDHEFPFPLDFPQDGVIAEITYAIGNPPGSDISFDITSVLNVSDVSVLNRTFLQCASSQSRSENFQIQVDVLSKLHIETIIRGFFSQGRLPCY